MDFACQYCVVSCTTSQGLRSHVAQSKTCLAKHQEKYALLDSDSESDDTSEASDEDLQQGQANSGAMNIDFPEPEDAMGHTMDFEDSDDNTPYPDPPPRPASVDETAAPASGDNPRKRPRATVEEVEDEDAQWFQHFPKDMAAGAILEKCSTQFEKLREEQRKAGRAPWEPFESEDEWELARWLMTSGISQTKTNEFLKLKKVRAFTNLHGCVLSKFPGAGRR